MSYTELLSSHTPAEEVVRYSNENWRTRLFLNRQGVDDTDSPVTVWSDHDASGAPVDLYRIAAGSGNVVLNLPAAGTANTDAANGRLFMAMRQDDGSGGFSATITANGSDTINNGSAGGSITLDSDNAFVAMVSNGSNNWEVLFTSGAVTGVARGSGVVTVTTTYTAGFEEVILCDATSAAFTVTLPAAASNKGKSYKIKKVDSSANAVTVDGNASETIDGATTVSLASQYDSTHIVCDGSAWYVL